MVMPNARLFGAAQLFAAERRRENSPAIYRWENMCEPNKNSPVEPVSFCCFGLLLFSVGAKLWG